MHLPSPEPQQIDSSADSVVDRTSAGSHQSFLQIGWRLPSSCGGFATAKVLTRFELATPMQFIILLQRYLFPLSTDLRQQKRNSILSIKHLQHIAVFELFEHGFQPRYRLCKASKRGERSLRIKLQRFGNVGSLVPTRLVLVVRIISSQSERQRCIHEQVGRG